MRALFFLLLLAPLALASDRLVAVGGGGTILTTDDGTSWSVSTFVTNHNLNAAFFYDDLTGWVVGDKTVLVTHDGGRTWMSTYNGGRVLSDVWFHDANEGWAVGTTGSILHSTDGGLNWSVQASPTSANLKAVVFADGQLGWAAGANVLLRTLNGGNTWSVVRTGGEVLQGLAFPSPTHGLAVGSSGSILETMDAGQSWSSNSFSTPAQLSDVFFASGSLGWIVGDKIALRTVNGGGTWTQTYAGGRALNAVAFSDTQRGWAVGSTGGLLRSTNGGQSWGSISSPTNAPLHDVAVVPGGVVVEYSLTVSASAGGAANPPSGSFPAGATVILDAIPDPGFRFVRWEGTGAGSYSGTLNPAQAVVLAPLTEKAIFELAVVVYVDASAPSGGNGSSTAPFRTVSRGAASVPADGIVIVRGGTYREQLTLGADGKGMTLQAEGGTVTIQS